MLGKIFDFMKNGQYNVAAQLLKGLNVSQQLLKKMVEKSVFSQIKNKQYEYSEFDNSYSIEIGNCWFFYGVHYKNNYYANRANDNNGFLSFGYEILGEEKKDLRFLTKQVFRKYLNRKKKFRTIIKKPCNLGVYRKVIKGIAREIIKEYHIC